LPASATLHVVDEPLIFRDEVVALLFNVSSIVNILERLIPDDEEDDEL
jgi:hypothetical protein